MTAEVVGMVGGAVVAVTSDGRVWFGRSYSPDEAEAAIGYLAEAVSRARGGESPTDMGKFT